MKASLSILGAIAILMQIFPALAETQVLHVVPAGTSGNTPQSPYATAETAANSISDALNAVSGDQPAVINVAPGVYAVDEEIKITKPNVTIQSRDAEGKLAREKTFIDGGYPEWFPKSVSNRLFKVSANNVTFKGLTLQNSFYRATGNGDGGAGIYVGNCSGLTVDSCAITNCCVGNGYGGGILFTTKTVSAMSHLITNTIVHSCVASGYGGGVSKNQVSSSKDETTDKNDWLLIDGCKFIGNNITKEGIFKPVSSTSNGGAHFGNAPVYVKNSLIEGGWGPQQLNTDAYAVFDNCTFSSFPDEKWALNTSATYCTRSFVRCVFKDTYLSFPTSVDAIVVFLAI